MELENRPSMESTRSCRAISCLLKSSFVHWYLLQGVYSSHAPASWNPVTAGIMQGSRKAKKENCLGREKKTHRILSTLLNFLAVMICDLSRQPTPNPCEPQLRPESTHLCPCPLSPNRQSHRVSPASVRSHISQPLDIVLQLLLQILLQRHLRQLPCQAVDLLVGQGADARRVVDVEFRHELRAGLRSEAVE